MKTNYLKLLPAAIVLALLGMSCEVNAAAFVQCYGEKNGNGPKPNYSDAVPDTNGNKNDNLKCMHLSAGDGFIKMADGRLQYMFGFADMTGTPEADAIDAGILAAASPAPLIELTEGDTFYLTLTNVGMIMRPDLADPHTVHFHGFPNASDIFDGVPDATISINMGASLTYYYNVVRPGTYMYRCHVEASEHMQMGMLGNLYVKPAQNNLPNGTPLGAHVHSTGDQYVYNDGDGSTIYDVEKAIQIGSFDPEFHDASMNTQPLPFANMRDTYPLLNGRGYPDTVQPGSLVPPAENGGKNSQNENALVEATSGQKILLRISNLNITNFYTLGTNGLTMKVVGRGASLMRGQGGADRYYDTNSVTVGGGEAVDVIIDTAGVAPGTYFLYTTNLNYLSNNTEDFGGMMTEIRIN
jgi:FtsP/CotA-like multicopper oxidase with cupredoxin domain